MSAFVVSEETMHRCVQTLCGSHPHYGQFVRIFAETTTNCSETPIGKALFAMNIAAVNDRYPSHAQDDTKAQTYRWRRQPNLSLIAGYKALECLRYQCSEGDIPDTDLFKELEAAIATIGGVIISQTPAYKAAAWG